MLCDETFSFVVALRLSIIREIKPIDNFAPETKQRAGDTHLFFFTHIIRQLPDR